MFRRRRFRRRVSTRGYRDRMTTWIHLHPIDGQEAYNTLQVDEQKTYVLVPATPGGTGRPRRFTGGVLKWSVEAGRDEGQRQIMMSVPFVVAYLPQGPMCLRFGSGLGAIVDPNTGAAATPGSSLIEPNQYVLAQGIINVRSQGSVVVSCRSSNISPGDSIVLVLINRNKQVVRMYGDIIFQYWSS